MAEALFYIGVLQLTVVFLSVAAGLLALHLFKRSHHKDLAAWKPLLIALIFFAIVELSGFLDAFGLVPEIVVVRFIAPALILAIVLVAVLQQIRLCEVKK